MALEEERQSGYATWERPTVFYNKYVKWVLYGLIVAFVVWSMWDIRISAARFVQGLVAAGELLENMFPPELTARKRELLVTGMMESINMSIVATILGILASIPIGFMAAENLAPRSLYYVNRGIISVTRAFHELIVAIIAVKAVGFGPLAGVLALSFKTIGFFGKLLAEDLEDIDDGQIEAVRAVGGSRFQVLAYGVLPQVLPRIVGLSIYRWDINIRHSTVVGIVGAGGIGVTLLNSFQKYDYDYSLTIILAIVAIVLVGEAVSAIVRRRVQ
jgi:phosphonate transport system permease protein